MKEDDRFVNFPSVDVQVPTGEEGKVLPLESKTCVFDKGDFEIVLRQDYYAANLIRQILNNNATVEGATHQEASLVCLLWKEGPGVVSFDLVVFTDLAVMHMIQTSPSERAVAARELIEKALLQLKSDGRIVYKPQKKNTVPHQKLSFHPMCNYKCIKTAVRLTFDVTEEDLDIGHVKNDRNLWHIMELNRLKRRIEELESELQISKKTCLPPPPQDAEPADEPAQ